MTFWNLVFAFGLAHFIDRALGFLFRRLGTYIANRAWDRATREPIRRHPAGLHPCYLCGELVKCNAPGLCMNSLHAHNPCLEQFAATELPVGPEVCVGGRPDA